MNYKYHAALRPNISQSITIIFPGHIVFCLFVSVNIYTQVVMACSVYSVVAHYIIRQLICELYVETYIHTTRT